MSSFDDLFGDIKKVKDQVKKQTSTTRAGSTISIPIDENTIFQYLEEAGEDPNRVQIVCDRLNVHEKIGKSKTRKRDEPNDARPGGSKRKKAINVILGESKKIKAVDANLNVGKERKEIDGNPGGSKKFNGSDGSPGGSKDLEMLEVRPGGSKEQEACDASPGGSKELEAIDHLQEIFPHLTVDFLKKKAGNCIMADIQKVVEAILNGDDPQDLHDESIVIIDDSPRLENNSVNDDLINLEETNLGDEMVDTSMTGEVLEAIPSDKNAGDLIDQNYWTLVTIFPDVDPNFLQSQSWDIGEDPIKLEAFIASSLENRSNLPSKKESEKKKEYQDEKEKIKTLTVNDFLEIWEDPHAHFANVSTAVSDLYKKHAIFQLRMKFPSIHHTLIVKALEETNHHFFPALQKITKMSPKKGKKRQAPLPDLPSEIDFNFSKEFRYSKLEIQIRLHQEGLEVDHNMAVKAARETGGLFDCECCFDGDCLLTEVAMCEEGHMFCKDCIRRGSGVQIGDQKTQISCLADCSSTFSLTVLKKNIPPNVFSRLLQKQQLEEVRAAGLEDLVQCPACNFATIMPDTLDKVVRCRNPECGKESCRLCQEENHIPLTCDEVEKDSDVADRVKLEKAMTEAMLRTCVGCQKQFFKEDGCNMMKCSCGATMCYLCRKPISHDYRHFNGKGAKCPLYSDNNNLHKDEVFKAANKAKEELNKNVKYDPTKDIEKPPEGFDPNVLPNMQAGPNIQGGWFGLAIMARMRAAMFVVEPVQPNAEPPRVDPVQPPRVQPKVQPRARPKAQPPRVEPVQPNDQPPKVWPKAQRRKAQPKVQKSTTRPEVKPRGQPPPVQPEVMPRAQPLQVQPVLLPRAQLDVQPECIVVEDDSDLDV